MQKIENKRFGEERALYNSHDLLIENCKFEGEEDGESALKESSNIEVKNSLFVLRYPLWHVTGLVLDNIEMRDTCRASLWYTDKASIVNSKMGGIKALRECSNIEIMNTEITSAEFGWRCKNVLLENCSLEGEYAFFGSKFVSFDKVKFTGKYSFQYNKNLMISNSVLNTKDAFWHVKNALVTNSEINGEYLGWYSENLTLINCVISGTQPFCYCKNLKLVNCTLKDCDLAFEYSTVNADIHGNIKSIKNPTKGKIIYDSCDNIILSNSKRPLKCKLIKRDDAK